MYYLLEVGDYVITRNNPFTLSKIALIEGIYGYNSHISSIDASLMSLLLVKQVKADDVIKELKQAIRNNTFDIVIGRIRPANDASVQAVLDWANTEEETTDEV